MHDSLGTVTVLFDASARYSEGGPSIGKKRNNLVQAVETPYLCFLDDDDRVSPEYIETLLRLCQGKPDVCTFRNLSTFDNYWTIVDMSLQNQNEESTPEDIVRRRPWHICPVKTEYAKQYQFPDLNYGEDWVWFAQVLNHCKTESKTNRLLHHYNHSLKTSAAAN